MVLSRVTNKKSSFLSFEPSKHGTAARTSFTMRAKSILGDMVEVTNEGRLISILSISKIAARFLVTGPDISRRYPVSKFSCVKKFSWLADKWVSFPTPKWVI